MRLVLVMPGQRKCNILIYEARQSVVMLARFLGLQADISLLGNTQVRKGEAEAQDGREGIII